MGKLEVVHEVEVGRIKFHDNHAAPASYENFSANYLDVSFRLVIMSGGTQHVH